MWCSNCNMETNSKTCPICGNATEEYLPVEIYWCESCNIPVIQNTRQTSKKVCPLCGGHMKYLSADLRPVFPEERLLVEILLNLEPNSLAHNSVWASENRYFVDGKIYTVPNKIYNTVDIGRTIEILEHNSQSGNYEYFDEYIRQFVKANSNHLNAIIDEAKRFVVNASQKFDQEHIVLSFSGGKDSTVTADLAIKALSNPSLVHIFGDTTLEFPFTTEYAERYRKTHPEAIFITARNDDQNFYSMCDEIGPPARIMRWCCSMFKTGPITRVINSLYRSQQILTFYGIRKEESVSRSKYNRIEDSADSVKIQQQTVASPIFSWKDIDIWLYILEEGIDFNEAYRLGYDRVGCWCCPNNNERAQFLSKIYMPNQSKKWHDFLIDFAKKIGKPDPEVYVDSGKWKARQGGNGLAAANDVKIKTTNCTAEEHAKIYQLFHPYSDELVGLFVPFGRIAPEYGNKLLHEVIVLDTRTNIPILSIQPFSHDGYEHAVKIKTLNVADHDDLQRQVGYQVRKFNACRKCLKCESICRAGAISITKSGYYIDPAKCVHCKACMNPKILDGGCTMDKYLRTK